MTVIPEDHCGSLNRRDKKNLHRRWKSKKASQLYNSIKQSLKPPPCCSEEQYERWREFAFYRTDAKRLLFSSDISVLDLFCMDCTPAYKKKMGSKCTNPDIVFVWHKMSEAQSGPGWYELKGKKPDHVRLVDIFAKEDDPAIIGGYKKMDVKR